MLELPARSYVLFETRVSNIILYSVSFEILKRDRDRRVHKNDHYVGGHFCEDAYERNGHGHASNFKRNTVL